MAKCLDSLSLLFLDLDYQQMYWTDFIKQSRYGEVLTSQHNNYARQNLHQAFLPKGHDAEQITRVLRVLVRIYRPALYNRAHRQPRWIISATTQVGLFKSTSTAFPSNEMKEGPTEPPKISHKVRLILQENS